MGTVALTGGKCRSCVKVKGWVIMARSCAKWMQIVVARYRWKNSARGGLNTTQWKKPSRHQAMRDTVLIIHCSKVPCRRREQAWKLLVDTREISTAMERTTGKSSRKRSRPNLVTFRIFGRPVAVDEQGRSLPIRQRLPQGEANAASRALTLHRCMGAPHSDIGRMTMSLTAEVSETVREDRSRHALRLRHDRGRKATAVDVITQMTRMRVMRRMIPSGCRHHAVGRNPPVHLPSDAMAVAAQLAVEARGLNARNLRQLQNGAAEAMRAMLGRACWTQMMACLPRTSAMVATATVTQRKANQPQRYLRRGDARDGRNQHLRHANGVEVAVGAAKGGGRRESARAVAGMVVAGGVYRPG
jgi:hypothetical protein